MLNIVASHTRPGATRSRTASESSANAKITIVTPGERQHLIGEDPAVPLDAQVLERRPAERCASTLTRPPPSPWTGNLVDAAGDDVDSTGGQRPGALELVAGDHDRGPGGRRLAEGVVEFVAGGGIEAGMGFVEQPQLRSSGDQAGECGAALLARRQLRHGHVGEPPGDAQTSIAACVSASVAPTVGAPEPDVLGDGEVEVQPVLVAEQPDVLADRLAVGWRGRSPARVPVPRTIGSSPAHSRSSVVLPAPFGPRSSTISPSSTRSVAPRRAPGTDRARRPRRRGPPPTCPPR